MQHVIARVDDDEFNLRLMDRWLRVAGYQTLMCATHAAAYELMRMTHPAVLLLDCSGHTDVLHAQQAYLRSRGGATLGKPVTTEERVANVGAVLGPRARSHGPAEGRVGRGRTCSGPLDRSPCDGQRWCDDSRRAEM